MRRRYGERPPPPRPEAPSSGSRDLRPGAAAARRSRGRPESGTGRRGTSRTDSRCASRLARAGSANQAARRQGLTRRLLGIDLSDRLGEVRVPLLALAGEADRVLAPPLAPVGERLRPAVVGVDRLVPTGGEGQNDARLPGPRHAGEEHPLHGAEDRGASPFRGVDKVGECGLEWGEVEINHEAPDDAPRRVRTHDR